ncbi:hypothetical protein OAE56_03250, partial [Verrucomicrobiales bacterium]|nr:hypothetical protein [Verrucomicrobiales bacterium]
GIDDGETSQTRPHSAIRLGSKILLHFYETGERELYDLEVDRAEQSALQDSPDAKSMGKMLGDYLGEVNARLPE